MNYTIILQVNLSNNPLDWQVKDLETLILDQGRIAMKELFAEVLKVYEKTLLKTHPASWDLKERWTKDIATRLGEMKLERYRVWDRREKRSRYPLDEALGIGKWQKETASFKKVTIEQTVQRSYRQSQKEVFNQTGVNRSPMSAWSLTQKESLKQQQKALEKNPVLPWKKLVLPTPPLLEQKDPCPAIGIDLDATYCRSWKGKKSFLKDHGVRVAVLYRHKVKTGKNRWQLYEKQVIGSGPGEPLEDFLNRVTHHAISHYGLHQNTQVVVHGDGDPWIRYYALKYFPKALYRLDPWHLKKKIREALNLQGKLPQSWEEAIYGNPNHLIMELKSLHRELTSEDTSYQKVLDLIRYIQNNKEGLLPSNVSSQKKQASPGLYKRGSGTIERNIDWTVNARFKLSRMSWTQKGLENLLSLRQDYLNNYKQPAYSPVPGSSPFWDFLS